MEFDIKRSSAVVYKQSYLNNFEGFLLVNAGNFELLPMIDSYDGQITFEVGDIPAECEEDDVDVCDYYVVGIRKLKEEWVKVRDIVSVYAGNGLHYSGGCEGAIKVVGGILNDLWDGLNSAIEGIDSTVLFSGLRGVRIAKIKPGQ